MSVSEADLISWCAGAAKADADWLRLTKLIALVDVETGCAEKTQAAVVAELEEWAVRTAEAAVLQIGLVAQTPASGPEGLRAKSSLLAAIVDGPYPLTDLVRSLVADMGRFLRAPATTSATIQVSPVPASLRVH